MAGFFHAQGTKGQEVIPEHVTTKYASAVKGAARDVYKAYGHIYGKRVLVAEAWGIAAARWDTWERTLPSPVGYARTDIRYRLLSWCRGNAEAEGFVRVRVPGGKQVMRRQEYLAYHPDFFVRAIVESTIGIPEAAYADNAEGLDSPCPYQLPTDWPVMTYRQVLKFGAVLYRDHLELCADFQRLAQEPRPEKRSAERWARTMELKRAGLRLKWARELAAARYEVLYGRKPPRELVA